MKIIGQRHRESHEDYCHHCGTIFECELSDVKKEKLSEETTIYLINCPNCGTELILGFNEYKLFPWVE